MELLPPQRGDPSRLATVSPARRPRLIGIAVLAVALGGAGFLGIRSLVGSRPNQVHPGCRAVDGTASYRLDLEQAANASTIAVVGKRLSMPDHAVTVALATALQESGLHNLDHGDRDSLGLFQQRPSQGWGSGGQIMLPRHAATAFYQRLMQVPSWPTLSVAQAAQAVQHSASPEAYARWEGEARVLARVMTGEAPAGLSCSSAARAPSGASRLLNQSLADEVGSPGVGIPVPPARGWAIASWLVGHGQRFGIRSVSFAGQTWTPGRGTWGASTTTAGIVKVESGLCCGT